MRNSLISTNDLKKYYNLDFVVPFEVDIEVGTSFGDGLEVEFDSSGVPQNVDSITSYVENN